MYLMRLDDASEYMDIEKWKRIENLLDEYNIKPIYGIIPNNKDPELLKYEKVKDFWKLMRNWKNKGWIPALHGYTHVFETNEGGMNPVNSRSEFAGVSLERQKQKIKRGYEILINNGIETIIFFPPAHTFDRNTLVALKEESSIRVVSDTVANDVYKNEEIYFIPQQSGRCRNLPFSVVTFCYHPNIMKNEDFEQLEKFLIKNKEKFVGLEKIQLKNRKFDFKDKVLKYAYFIRRK